MGTASRDESGFQFWKQPRGGWSWGGEKPAEMTGFKGRVHGASTNSPVCSSPLRPGRLWSRCLSRAAVPEGHGKKQVHLVINASGKELPSTRENSERRGNVTFDVFSVRSKVVRFKTATFTARPSPQTSNVVSETGAAPS